MVKAKNGAFSHLTHLKHQGQVSSCTHSNHHNGKWQYAVTSPIIPQTTTKHYVAETWNWNRCPRNIFRSKQSSLVHHWSCFSSWPQHQVQSCTQWLMQFDLPIWSRHKARISTFSCTAWQAASQIGKEWTNLWRCLALHWHNIWLLMQLQKRMPCTKDAKANNRRTTCVHAVLQCTTEVELCKPCSKHNRCYMLLEAAQSWHYPFPNPFHLSIMAINRSNFFDEYSCTRKLEPTS